MEVDQHELNRELGELKAKMDMVLETLRDLRKNYVTNEVFGSLDVRVTRLETAPTRWLPIIVAGVSVLLHFTK